MYRKVLSFLLAQSSEIALFTIEIIVIVLYKKIVPTKVLEFDLKDYSLNHEFVPEKLNGVLIVLINIAIASILIVINDQVRKVDFHITVPKLWYCGLHGNSITLIITYFLKSITGSLRPSFFALCQLNETVVNSIDGTWVNRSMSQIICTSEDAVDGRRSFPSGHASQVIPKSSESQTGF